MTKENFQENNNLNEQLNSYEKIKQKIVANLQEYLNEKLIPFQKDSLKSLVGKEPVKTLLSQLKNDFTKIHNDCKEKIDEVFQNIEMAHGISALKHLVDVESIMKTKINLNIDNFVSSLENTESEKSNAEKNDLKEYSEAMDNVFKYIEENSSEALDKFEKELKKVFNR